MNSRRNFLFNLAVSAATPALLCGRALAQTPPPVKLEETDPVAMALGYKEDTTKVDAQKYPNTPTNKNAPAAPSTPENPAMPQVPARPSAVNW